MTLRKAIEVLNTYQSWRIGEEDVDMQKPSVVTEAINTLLDFTDSPEFFANMSEKPTDHKEIPDAEILKQSKRLCWEKAQEAFIIGARWYRDQIKQNK
jgi:hypothetical protein